MWHMFRYGYGYPGGMFLMMGLGVVVCIIIAVWLVKMFKDENYHDSNALKILGEKYAKGEINEDEYIQKKNILRKK